MLARLPYQALRVGLEVTHTQKSIFVKFNPIFKVKGCPLIHIMILVKIHHKIYVMIGNNILYYVDQK